MHVYHATQQQHSSISIIGFQATEEATESAEKIVPQHNATQHNQYNTTYTTYKTHRHTVSG